MLGFAPCRGDTAGVAEKKRNPKPPASDIEPRFMTLDDVAAYLAVSVPQVYALVRSGELTAVKIGGRGVWRVSRDKLEEYVERLEAKTADWAKSHPLNPRERATPEELE